jgi:cell division topological specificity factor
MMNLLRLIGGRTASAPVARERLQILLAHERGLRGQADLLGILRAEILAVVSRHIVLDPEKVTVRMDRSKHVSTLEVDIEVPTGVEISCGRCDMIALSDIRWPGFSSERNVMRRRPLKSLNLGMASPVAYAWPGVVDQSSSADCRTVRYRRAADVR